MEVRLVLTVISSLFFSMSFSWAAAVKYGLFISVNLPFLIIIIIIITIIIIMIIVIISVMMIIIITIVVVVTACDKVWL